MKSSFIRISMLLFLLNFSFLSNSQQLELMNSGTLNSGIGNNEFTWPSGTVNVPSPPTVSNHWTNENGDLNVSVANTLGVKTWYLAPKDFGSFIELIQAAVVPHQLKYSNPSIPAQNITIIRFIDKAKVMFFRSKPGQPGVVGLGRIVKFKVDDSLEDDSDPADSVMFHREQNSVYNLDLPGLSWFNFIDEEVDNAPVDFQRMRVNFIAMAVLNPIQPGLPPLATLDYKAEIRVKWDISQNKAVIDTATVSNGHFTPIQINFQSYDD